LVAYENDASKMSLFSGEKTYILVQGLLYAVFRWFF